MFCVAWITHLSLSDLVTGVYYVHSLSSMAWDDVKESDYGAYVEGFRGLRTAFTDAGHNPFCCTGSPSCFS